MAGLEPYDACVALHSAEIRDRGGRRRRFPLIMPRSVKWGRTRDDTSEAEVVVSGRACSENRDLLSSIEPKRDELVIFRGEERVWEGPVWRVAWHSDRVVIVAHDVTEYLNGTPLTREYSNRYPNQTEVTTRIGNIIEQEVGVWETLDPPANVLPHLKVHHFPNEAKTSALTIPFQMTVGEHLDDLARVSGIDHTAVGRAIHIWDTSRSLGRTRTLTESDFLGDVIITAYGADHTEMAYVVTESGAYGVAGSPSSYYGPWTKIFTVYNEEGTEEPTQAELDSQAQRNRAGRSPVPVQVRIPDNSSIRLSYDLTIGDLVPGVQMPLRATLNAREVAQLQKLDKLTVTETSAGENVQVTLSPANKPDSNEVTP